MPSPGLVLDRDGTLVVEAGHLSEPSQLVPIDGSREAVDRAVTAGVRIAVVTNQSAVARGIVTELGLSRVHARLRELFPGIERVYHCPHLPNEDCSCRKPAPELVIRALHDLDLDPARTLLVGDHLSDCMAGRAAGIAAVLVRTGHGDNHADEAEAAGFAVHDDLADAIDRFLSGLEAA